jgi:hypothetical protein
MTKTRKETNKENGTGEERNNNPEMMPSENHPEMS